MGREFVSTVRRPSYLIVTLGMPFFLSAYLALVGLAGQNLDAGHAAKLIIRTGWQQDGVGNIENHWVRDERAGTGSVSKYAVAS